MMEARVSLFSFSVFFFNVHRSASVVFRNGSFSPVFCSSRSSVVLNSTASNLLTTVDIAKTIECGDYFICDSPDSSDRRKEIELIDSPD